MRRFGEQERLTRISACTSPLSATVYFTAWKLQLNHVARVGRATPAGIRVREVRVPKYLSPTPEGRVEPVERYHGRRGGVHTQGARGAPFLRARHRVSLYQPTSAVSFLRDPPPAVSRGEQYQLDDSQECDWASPRKRVLC